MPSKKPHPAATYHHAYLEAIEHYIDPANIVATIIVKKLQSEGIDGARHFDAIKQSVKEIIASDHEDNESWFEFEFDDGGANKISIQLDGDEFEKAGQEILDRIDAVAEKIFDSLTQSATKSTLTNSATRLLHLTNERDAFVRRLEHTWADAFKFLDIHLAICQEIGALRNDWLRTKRRRSKDLIVVDVITRLHGRALTIASEVQTLLRNGFADGALSRWRTIHELAVTAMFISEHGKPVAERYAAHLAADSIKTARQYQKFASVLGYRPIGPKEQKRLDKEAQELAQKFGKPFLNDYGWAADALKIPQPNFASIEAAVNLDRFRPYFKLASGTVHAGAKGTYHRLGVLDDRDLILVGSSNVGLEEAGRLVTISLNHITMVLLMLHSNTDSIVWGRILHELSTKVENKFLKIARKIEREERQLRKEALPSE